MRFQSPSASLRTDLSARAAAARLFIIAIPSSGHPNTGSRCCMARCGFGCARSSRRSRRIGRDHRQRCLVTRPWASVRRNPAPHVSHVSHVSVSDFVRRVRGRSSRKRQQEFGHIRKRRWGQRFRVRGYFSTTSGNITDDVVMNCPDKHTKPTKGFSQSHRTCRRQPVCHSVACSRNASCLRFVPSVPNEVEGRGRPRPPTPRLPPRKRSTA